MKKTARSLTAVTAAVIAVGMAGVPVGTMAAPVSSAVVAGQYEDMGYKTTEDGFVYHPLSDNKHCTLIDYVGTAEDLIIPEKLDGLEVSGFECIGDSEELGFRDLKTVKSVTVNAGIEYLPGVFANCKKLEKVTLPDTVTDIGDYAFVECVELRYVKLPKALDHVGTGAFRSTAWLTVREEEDGIVVLGNTLVSGRLAEGDIIIPGNVKYINVYAFSGNDTMTSLVIPGSVTRIPEYAVCGCNALKKVTVCNGVRGIGAQAFGENPALEKLILPPSIEAMSVKPVSGAYRKKTVFYYYRGTYVEKWFKTKAEFNYRRSVLPGKTTSLKITPGIMTATVKWDKVSTASGYQVQIATDNKFSKDRRTATVKGRNNTSRKLVHLRPGRKYYIRQRSYRVVAGKKYYGNFTRTRVVTLKKH